MSSAQRVVQAGSQPLLLQQNATIRESAQVYELQCPGRKPGYQVRNSRRRGVGWEKAALEWSITRPTAEKLKLQLAALDKKIDVKAAELQAHKEIMMRSRYTPEGLKAATAKRTKLENELGSLQKQRKVVLKQLESIKPTSKPPSAAVLTALVERHLKAGDLKFTGKAPRKDDILSTTEVHRRPFTYTAIVLKSDPRSVIIKQVLTGGFVPARPGDGSYSQPVALKP